MGWPMAKGEIKTINKNDIVNLRVFKIKFYALANLRLKRSKVFYFFSHLCNENVKLLFLCQLDDTGATKNNHAKN